MDDVPGVEEITYIMSSLSCCNQPLQQVDDLYFWQCEVCGTAHGLDDTVTMVTDVHVSETVRATRKDEVPDVEEMADLMSSLSCCNQPLQQVDDLNFWQCEVCGAAQGLDDTLTMATDVHANETVRATRKDEVLDIAEMADLMSSLRCCNQPLQQVDDLNFWQCEVCGMAQGLDDTVTDADVSEMIRLVLDSANSTVMSREANAYEVEVPFPTTEDNNKGSKPSGRTKLGRGDLDQLKPGDHIAWHRPLAYWHHAIVKSVEEAWRLLVIHYSGPPRKREGKGRVQEEWLEVNPDKQDVYRIDYNNCLPPHEVIARAEARLGETLYNLLASNCEHFARFCKTGFSISDQVRSLIKTGLKSVGKTITSLLKDGIILVRAVFKKLLPVKGVAKVVGRDVTEGVVSGSAGVVLVGLEAGFTIWDIYKAWQQKQREDISMVDFKRFIVQRVLQGVGATAGATGGMILGQLLIPIPILGGLIGIILGQLGGEIGGRLLGRQLGRLIPEDRQLEQDKTQQQLLPLEHPHNMGTFVEHVLMDKGRGVYYG